MLLREARAQAGCTQAGLAEASGVPASVISAIESGQRDPSTRTLERLLASLGYELGIVPRRSSSARHDSSEFVEALRLADALPRESGGRLNFPRLRT